MSRKPAQTAVMPERLIDFSDPIATNLGKKGTVMIGITGCSDGEAFVLMIDDVEAGSFVLHSINQSGKTRTYEALTVPGYADIGPATRFFVDEKYVAELATGRKVMPGATSGPDVQPGDLVILFKRDGSFVSAFPPPTGFEVKSLGVFENTGNVLLIGISSDDRKTRLSLLTYTKGR